MNFFPRYLDILDPFIHLPSLPHLYLLSQGLLEKVTDTLIWCHCKLMASTLSWILDEASYSCYISSVSSSPTLSPLTSFSHPPFPPLTSKGQSIIHPFPLFLLGTIAYVSLFLSMAVFWVLFPVTPSSTSNWQINSILSLQFSLFTKVFPSEYKIFSGLFHLKKICKHLHATP